VQEISALDVPLSSYDVAWLSAAMYSCLPTRERRVRQALRPGGHFVCGFHWGVQEQHSPRAERVLRLAAALSRGNLAYELGDMLWHQVEFIHGFLSEEALRAEFAAGGFEIVHLQVRAERARGEAVLRREA
jgi:hypothetical protein